MEHMTPQSHPHGVEYSGNNWEQHEWENAGTAKAAEILKKLENQETENQNK